MLTNQVKECEGKWELIEKMVDSMCEIPASSDESLREEIV